ncbi:endolytic transglycosylase MltG [Domibacillus enclensis]|uniref:YceG-like family protein n=1 Tax=Domibacillus enclensis TaxID=1017273 RepID=A0A1N6PL85_9BACI|nr:endolytic transglycosylase MltG [Domibacillus enclensis]OXS80408.1 hypothetical protein B1B05_02710 [Domibacillus enclensis]SIQ05144.1 YceG-like family protein [Domibacillus enclensis]
MNKQTMRSFGFGLLTAAAALWLFLQMEPVEQAELSTDEMIEHLEAEQYIIQKAEETPSETAETAPETPAKPSSPEAGTAVPEADTVSISVTAGMTSNDVSTQLKTAGLISDAAAFNQFLTENGYSAKLQVGSFELKKGMSAQNIADVLTK